MSSSKFLARLNKELENYDSERLKNSHPVKDEPFWVSTGSAELDYNLHTWGVKKGIIEISGESRAGKTTMGLTIIARFLKQFENAICVFMLSEQRIDDLYVKRLGVDTGRLFKVSSTFVEDLFFKLQTHIDKVEEVWHEEKLPGKPKIIILWDSIGATNSRAELETFRENVNNYKNSADKGNAFKLKHAKMADFAKTAKGCVKAIFSQLYEKDIVFICLNHLNDDINSPVASKASTGGRWREFFCYLRLEMQRNKMESAKLRIDEEEWGQITDVKIIKNDFGGYKRTKIQLCLGYGITLSDDDIQFGVKAGIIKKEGEKKFSFLNGKLTWSTPRSFYSLYRTENPLIKILQNKIIEARHQALLNEGEVKSDEEE